MNEEVVKRLRKRLAASKAWITGDSSTLKDLVDDHKPDRMAIERATQDLEKRMDAFYNIQSELELEISDEEIDQCVTEAAEFKKSHTGVLLKAAKILKEFEDKEESVKGESTRSGSCHSSNCSHYSRHAVPNARLPKIDLPKFDGTIVSWQPFWDKFKALVDNTDIPPITKFTYLTSVLEGEAKNVLKGISVTDKNYVVACDLLKGRYGRPERIIFAHIQSLLSLNCSTETRSTVASLWALEDTLLSNIRSLETLAQAKNHGHCPW